MAASEVVTLEKLVSLCKRRGFVFQSAEIYGGLNGVYEFGPMGTLLKQNIRSEWTKSMVTKMGDVVLMEGALLGPHDMWLASGHVEGFHDPMVDCTECKRRYRTDDIDLEKACPHCGNKAWTAERQFNMMFKTNLGAMSDQASTAYLRPETAQAIFVNFKNVMGTNRLKVPFGIAQIGKAFRNEITPKQFLFRMREFEQMEMEWFCKSETAEHFFKAWSDNRIEFYQHLGIRADRLKLRLYDKDELAHYADACNDVEYQYPFGWRELEGIANRTDFDLSRHIKHSGKDLAVFDEETKKSFVPYVIECSVGVDRLFLTLLCDAYDEEEIEGDTRTVLRFKPIVAPVKAAILPLTKKQAEPARKIFDDIRPCYNVQWDVTGSIGKRYRRQDEIGTPVCFTYDFDSETDGCVTARDRDTTKQERIPIDSIKQYIQDYLDR